MSMPRLDYDMGPAPVKLDTARNCGTEALEVLRIAIEVSDTLNSAIKGAIKQLNHHAEVLEMLQQVVATTVKTTSDVDFKRHLLHTK